MDQTQTFLQDDPFGGLGDFVIASELAVFIRYWWGGKMIYGHDAEGSYWYWEAG